MPGTALEKIRGLLAQGDGRRADLVLIVLFTALACGRLLWLADVYVDDNCWLLAVYNTSGLSGFLDTGFRELRRVPQGIFLYGLFATHALLEGAVYWWQAINLLLQGLTASGIYLLVRALPGNFRLAAFASSILFLVAPVDTTLPVFSNLTTRTGLLLSVFSLYWTARAVQTGRRALWLVPALLASLFTNYVLVEGALALEPGRFLLAAALLRQKGADLKGAVLGALKISLLFGLSLVPLVVYKMLYKPYGIYGGYYETGVKFVFKYKMWKQAFKHFRFDNWGVLKDLITGFPGWAALLGAAGGGLAWLRLSVPAERDGEGGLTNGCVAWLGLALLIFPLMFYMYAGKVPSYGIDTRHGIIMQLGNAVMLGGLLAWLLGRFGKAQVRASAALLLAAGVFFTNVNLDQFFKTWEHKKDFWAAFTARFPGLPPEADFVMSAENGHLLYRYYADYDFEYPLNMLYSREAGRGAVRKYRVIPAAEFPAGQKGVFERPGHYGTDRFDAGKLIPVAYKGGRLYAGAETAELGGVYAGLAGNPLPACGGGETYPLRARARCLP